MQVFFGGVKNHEKQRLPYRQNFHGCMENIAFNLAYVSDLARRKKPSVRVEVSIGMLVSWGPGVETLGSVVVMLHSSTQSDAAGASSNRASADPALVGHVGPCIVA